MDTFSHALWGKGLFGYRKYRWTAFIFGALPDLSSFGLLFLFNLITNPQNLNMGKPSLSEIPHWVFTSYNISHSLITALFFLFLTYCINKDLFFPMLAWPLHIIIDFFTHTIYYFPTPIFWPISDYRFNGISWANKYIFLTNVICIVIIFLYRKKYFQRKFNA
tara:strand:+ start:12 stop:500 length:489 start_codon:yes stop_codon:yes gene_type:complete